MKKEVEEIATAVVDAAMKLHMTLGPGLLETVYEVILEDELTRRGFKVERQRSIPIRYQGHEFDEGFRADLVINGCFIVELKSVEALQPVHGKQLLTYLRLTGFPLGLLINFGAAFLKDGLKRVAN